MKNISNSFLILCLFSVIGLLPLPYTFYVVSRIIFTLVLIFEGYRLRRSGERIWLIAMALVVLYNPIIPVYLRSKLLWFVANLGTLCFIYFSNKKLRNDSLAYVNYLHAVQQNQIDINKNIEKKVLERTAELERVNSELLHLSEHDALTGLPNRLSASRRLGFEFSRMRRTGAAYAVMMLDIDHFKKINDNHGHAIGDQVLQQTAKCLQSSVRESDFVARFGGEEFLVLLPETSLAEASHVAEKIRYAIEAEPHAINGKITVSIGVAKSSRDHANEIVALNEADTLLYVAKQKGRNQVVVEKNQASV